MGLQIIRPDTDIDFIGLRKWAFLLSGLLILVGVLSLIVKGGPKYGIDFAGGVIVQVKFDQSVDVKELKQALKEASLPSLVVQRFGDKEDNEYLLRTSADKFSPEKIRSLVEENLKKNLPGKKFEIQRLEMVGPKVGADLRSKALEALFYAVLLIAIYISGRFEQRWMTAGVMAAGLALGVYVLKLLTMPMSVLIVAAMLITLGLCWYLKLNYALGAVLALIHDVFITVGIFSLLDKEFDLTIVAALLTIVGYSLNDTIIVFDRIRENLRAKISPSLARTINVSINQTLSRTILTSGTTLIVVVCLFLFGGGVIHDFAFALLVGVLVGTYSSIYVASPILLGFKPKVEEEA
ncbi:protein translocase subunit SecF [Desulfohalobiaceae bacterium Ax17]|jgi:preprotein translocase subunit SecF|uniref:protein translocase subunit SecF n=1 Tax=Desulfovulcanus ferrireducens TaxID=2831190 RepID=UPI00207BA6B6|nr:protein translocase subunit SecF [Desulfovulcanus ferrireducens]MBT8763607.1 protein translocase subunit SecF [Desulfovulcanus ferrireducens]